MHGGAAPGAPRGQANGSYKTGHYTKEAIALRRQIRAWVRQMSAFAKAARE
jgi:hypothetical protein